MLKEYYLGDLDKSAAPAKATTSQATPAKSSAPKKEEQTSLLPYLIAAVVIGVAAYLVFTKL